MSERALEIRMARLEGAYEQIDRRLGSVDSRLDRVEKKLDERVASLQWRLTSLIVVTWLTTIATILFKH